MSGLASITSLDGNFDGSHEIRRNSSKVESVENLHEKINCDNDGFNSNSINDKCLKTNSNSIKENAIITKDFNMNNSERTEEFVAKIRWPDLAAQLFLHIGAIYGLILLFSVQLATILWALLVILMSGVGITAGAHRLWSHRSYRASLPLRMLLMFLFTITGQRDIYTWALDHRIHHKFSETEADPHNAKRGFLFAHVGWLFLTPHPQVVEKRKTIYIEDLRNDGIVMFQRQWYIPLFAICAIGLPVLIPWYYWNECLWQSFWVNFNLRFCCTLNAAFFVNSVAHMWGNRPYDKYISPVENRLVSFMALGEGWHNYHHVFPWDYKTGEFGDYGLNITTAFIDICVKLGLASGCKLVSSDMIKRRALRCGDGTIYTANRNGNSISSQVDTQIWGYGDEDLLLEDINELNQM